MRLDAGPLRVRIEAEGQAEGQTLDGILARAAAGGLVLALPGEEADLVARPAPVAAAPARDAAGRGMRSPAPLSPRELEILAYLVDGWSNAEIASALRIGLRTVRFHLEGIYGKLGVARRGEAAREALRLGLVRFEA